MNPTLHITPQIIEFAARVRFQLADLPAEEVDDLTEGLEADLTEAFAEDLARELPDPAEYALELRTAAGLPPQESEKSGVRESFKGVKESFRLKGESVLARLRDNQFTSGALDMLIELRPVWWVLRAVIAYLLATEMFGHQGIPVVPQDFGQWMLLGVFVVISVQWGRGHWQQPWMHRLLIAGNVIAALALLPVIQHTYDNSLTWREAEVAFGYNQGGSDPEADEPRAGVLLNGNEVTNIFVYGPDGKALKGVQLFDQNGKPLATSVPGGNGCMENTPCVDGDDEEGAGVWVPGVLETGAKAWNVFPLLMQTAKYDDNTGQLVADPQYEPTERTPPFLKVPATMTTPEGGPKAEKKGAQSND